MDALIGPDTVNTMPDQTIAAARDHATASRSIEHEPEAAHELLDQLRRLGVPFDQIVEHELVDEGVAAFANSFDSLIQTIAEKAEAITGREAAAAR